jgi:hypothetical protein
MEGLWSILPVVISIIAPALTLLVAWVCRKIATKLDIQNTHHLDALIDAIVRRATDAVEQLSQAAKKRGDAAIASGDKLAMAIGMVLAELKVLGLPELAEAVITERIEAYLRINSEWEEGSP